MKIIHECLFLFLIKRQYFIHRHNDFINSRESTNESFYKKCTHVVVVISFSNFQSLYNIYKIMFFQCYWWCFSLLNMNWKDGQIKNVLDKGDTVKFKGHHENSRNIKSEIIFEKLRPVTFTILVIAKTL